MFYINTRTYKLAEGHKHCTQSQNLLRTANQGGEKLGAERVGGGSLLKPFYNRSASLDPTTLGVASPEGDAIRDKHKVQERIKGPGVQWCFSLWQSAEKTHKVSKFGVNIYSLSTSSRPFFLCNSRK